MIAVDTNVLVYAHREDSPWHAQALESPTVNLLHEGVDHWSSLSSLLLQSGRISGPQVHDTRVVALCVQHGVKELWTADRDFGRFPALTTRNPLVG